MTRQPTKWTPALAVRATIYLTTVTLLLALSSEVRNGIGYMLGLVAVIAAACAGPLLALLLMLGVKVSRR